MLYVTLINITGEYLHLQQLLFISVLFSLTLPKLSWFQQALAGCQEFSFIQYPHCCMDLEPLKITTTTEEAKTW